MPKHVGPVIPIDPEDVKNADGTPAARRYRCRNCGRVDTLQITGGLPGDCSMARLPTEEEFEPEAVLQELEKKHVKKIWKRPEIKD